MLNLGAIQISKNEKDQFKSNLFLMKQKNGKFKPVINVRKLNEFVKYKCDRAFEERCFFLPQLIGKMHISLFQ